MGVVGWADKDEPGYLTGRRLGFCKETKKRRADMIVKTSLRAGEDETDDLEIDVVL